MHLPKSQLKILMTRALGGTNHFGIRSYAQVFTHGHNINQNNVGRISLNNLMGVNPSPKIQWDWGSTMNHRGPHKVSAQSSNPSVVHKQKDTSTKILYNQQTTKWGGFKVLSQTQGKLCRDSTVNFNHRRVCISNSDPNKDTPVYNRYQALESLVENGGPYDSGSNNWDNDIPSHTTRAAHVKTSRATGKKPVQTWSLETNNRNCYGTDPRIQNQHMDNRMVGPSCTDSLYFQPCDEFLVVYLSPLSGPIKAPPEYGIQSQIFVWHTL